MSTIKHPVALYFWNVAACYLVFLGVTGFSGNSPYFSRGSGPALAVLILGLVFAAYVVVQDVLLYREAPLRRFAMLSTSAVVADLIMIVVDIQANPTSHNLAPLEMIMFGFSSLLAFSCLFVIMRLVSWIAPKFKR